MYLGIDIGSCAVKAVLSDENLKIMRSFYLRNEGEPLNKTLGILKEIELDYKDMEFISVTGCGGGLLAEISGVPFVNEILAQSIATQRLHPEVRSIIEIGGEDSKLIRIAPHEIEDFDLNTICAAGTGSFLEREAGRLCIRIEDFGELALRCKNPPRIAGRCSVFATTDMIHLQQEGTPVEDIVAGLCFALARNFKSIIAKGKTIKPPVSFQGGVAANKGIIHAFKSVLSLNDEKFIVPTYFAHMGAIGSVIAAKERLIKGSFSSTLEECVESLKIYLREQKPVVGKMAPLIMTRKDEKSEGRREKGEERKGKRERDVWMGIDVGSVSTNVILIDRDKKLISYRYLSTSGRPIEAVRKGIREIGREVVNVSVRGVGVTGSGRYMIGDIVGADVIKNEITAQATAGIEIDPNVNTIFEIGGQDSKYISIKNGKVVDFELNKVCAAGTGSFLEEQAKRLGYEIKDEFSKYAFLSKAPIFLGERCTVFIDSSLSQKLERGAKREDIAAGLAYSICYNYLNRVVSSHKIGDNIFFQGAVALNKAVVSAFENILKKQIVVPPYCDITGAIGVAIIAQREYEGESRFRGFRGFEEDIKVKTFICPDCANSCEIKTVKVENESYFYGSRCDKYDVKREKSTIPDYFRERERLLYRELSEVGQSLRRIGIPLFLAIYEYLPFFAAFFKNLGFDVITSDPTKNYTIHKGVETSIAEHCFPVKVAHGHIINITKKDVDYIFLPSFISYEKEKGFNESYACPYVQGLPYVIKASLGEVLKGKKVITPIIHARRGRVYVREELVRLGTRLGYSRDRVEKAIEVARNAQKNFRKSCRERGREILGSLRDNTIVLLGRPYNTCDPGLSLGIPKVLRDIGLNVIPADFLPIEEKEIAYSYPNMYWRYGQRILSALRVIKRNPYLFPVYITNFGCGADSFILHYFEKEMGDRPYLIIEVDEHSSPHGIITRLEAFKETLGKVSLPEKEESPFIAKQTDYIGKTVFIPYMGNGSYAIESAFIHCRIPAEVMPISDDTSIEYGRKFTSGKECFPCILTAGDMLKVLSSHPPDKVCFFMPSASGPCMFGQYNLLHRIILKEAGFETVPIMSPNQARDLYGTLRGYGKDFNKRAWWGMCAMDALDRIIRSTRPYEVNRGETDGLEKNGVEFIREAIKGNGDIREVMRRIRKMWAEIEVKVSKRPIIGVTGEIYVRAHQFANNDLIRRIESLGGEVWLAPYAEWFLYTNFRRREDDLVFRLPKKYIRDSLMGLYQRWVEREVHKSAGLLEEAGTYELFKDSNPYLHQSVEGEAVLTVGKAIDFIKKGASGIVTVMPFTCMPGTNAQAVMSRVKNKTGIPYLNIVYDGLSYGTHEISLEAFIWQAKQYTPHLL